MSKYFKGFLIAAAIVFLFGGITSSVSRAQDSKAGEVTYFNQERVEAAFAKSGAIFSYPPTDRKYSILTLRRDHPGEVEIHKLDTDIVYVVSGTATFVTGGTPVDAKPTAPEELRGKSIEGGTAHVLQKGEIIVVPAGVPHWFKEVPAPFLYLTVKVR